MVDQIQNFVRGQLTSSVSNSTSTFPVGNAGAFPDPADGEYDVTIFDGATYERAGADPAVEIVRVLGRDTSADELTVARGQQDTSAEPHPDTSVIVQGITAGLLQQLASNPLSETLDANGNDVTNVGAFEADELSDGVAGSGNSTSLIAGDAGDFVPLVSIDFLSGQFANISSTNFTQIGLLEDSIVAPDYDSFLQNVEQRQVVFGFRADSYNNGATEITVRHRATPESEVTTSGTSSQRSEPVDDGSIDGSLQYLEAKVDAGDVDLGNMTLVLGGEIA